MDTFDVLVVGGGNAGLCAALAASQLSRKILLVERAPEPLRGGNTRHTRDIRYAHDRDPYTTGVYSVEEFLTDLSRVTGEPITDGLARLTVEESQGVPAWMEKHGVRWQKPLYGTLHLARTNRFFLGGGKALVNTYFYAAMKRGIKVLYDAPVEQLIIEDGRFKAAIISIGKTVVTVPAKAVVVASGGFEANISWLMEYWGPGAANFIIRGTRYNDGKMLANLLTCGAKPIGNPRGVHAIAVDARSPKFDGGIATRVDSIPFGIVVNRTGQRFYDEGEDLWPKRYASWGALIAEQPEQIAYSIFDAKVRSYFIPPMYRPLQANSLSALSAMLDVDRANFLQTIKQYNACTTPDASFDPTILDGRRTTGLEPPKSNWALPIDTPPFYAYPLRPGVTFTYLGITVDEKARVLTVSGEPLENVYAAGEIMAGNILSKGYLAGFGLTIGTVFGRIAGRNAATHS